jgi:hypothetical protein
MGGHNKGRGVEGPQVHWLAQVARILQGNLHFHLFSSRVSFGGGNTSVAGCVWGLLPILGRRSLFPVFPSS